MAQPEAPEVTRPDIASAETDDGGRAEPYPPTIEKLARDGGDKLIDGEEQMDALEWFLSDQEAEEDVAQAVKVLEVNVSASKVPKIVQWHIRTITPDELREIQRSAQPNRAQRRSGGETDPDKSNLAMIVAATVYPDLRKAAQTKGIADPAHVLRHRFGHKPGLISQIAAEILLFSGFDDEDVREAKEVRAAGN